MVANRESCSMDSQQRNPRERTWTALFLIGWWTESAWRTAERLLNRYCKEAKNLDFAYAFGRTTGKKSCDVRIKSGRPCWCCVRPLKEVFTGGLGMYLAHLLVIHCCRTVVSKWSNHCGILSGDKIVTFVIGWGWDGQLLRSIRSPGWTEEKKPCFLVTFAPVICGNILRTVWLWSLCYSSIKSIPKAKPGPCSQLSWIVLRIKACPPESWLHHFLYFYTFVWNRFTMYASGKVISDKKRALNNSYSSLSLLHLLDLIYCPIS